MGFLHFNLPLVVQGEARILVHCKINFFSGLYEKCLTQLDLIALRVNITKKTSNHDKNQLGKSLKILRYPHHIKENQSLEMDIGRWEEGIQEKYKEISEKNMVQQNFANSRSPHSSEKKDKEKHYVNGKACKNNYAHAWTNESSRCRCEIWLESYCNNGERKQWTLKNKQTIGQSVLALTVMIRH